MVYINLWNFELGEKWNVNEEASANVTTNFQDMALNKCNQCKYASSQARNLKRHLKRHSVEKANKCNQCDYASSEAGNLRRHLKKSNKCNQCDYASSCANALRRHLKTHSGEKPNKCNQCEYASIHVGNLRKHLKTHSGEKPNKCSQCGYASIRASQLVTHMKRHVWERWRDWSTLFKPGHMWGKRWKHLRIHNGEKTHKYLRCNLCFPAVEVTFIDTHCKKE